MSTVQFIKVVSQTPGQRGALREILPGFKRVWEVLSKGFEGVEAQNHVFLEIRWPSGFKAPDERSYQKLLAFKGQLSVELVSQAIDLEFLIVNQGLPNAFENLLMESLEQEFKITPLFVKEHSLFSFDLPEGKSSYERSLTEALEKLAQVEFTKLGLGGVGFRELVFLRPGDQYGEWNIVPVTETDTVSASLKDEIFLSINQAQLSPLKREFKITEKRPRHSDNNVAENSLSVILEKLYEGSLSHVGTLSPGTFMTGAHLRSIEKVLDQMSMGDISAGALISLPAFSSPIYAEMFSELPLGRTQFPKAPEGGADLYMLGPWSSKNVIIQKRLANMHRHERLFADTGFNAVIFEGLEDWLGVVVSSLTKESGWESSEQTFKKFLEKVRNRDRSDRAAFFWTQKSSEDIALLGKKYGVPFLKIGNTAFSGHLKIWSTTGDAVFDMSLEDLEAQIETQVEPQILRWEYPEPKSPTYGLERASIYPEQYLLKVLIWSLSDLNNVRMGTALHSGVQIRTSRARKKYCQPMNTLVWSDGKMEYVDAVSTHSGWSGIDPRGAGLASFDSCVRESVVMGAKPGMGVCSLWIPYPTDPDNETLTAWYLTMLGALDGVREYGYKLSSVCISGSTHASNLQDVFVKIRAPLKDSKIKVVPGFRMEGEAIYSVGPKPAVVDAGSRILKYVRVQSNNTFKLQPSLQLKLYDIVYECFTKGMISSIRSVDNGGIAKILAEMGLWGDLGIHHRPTVPTMELYSGTPGRLIVGVLPQEVKKFEAAVGTEYATLIGIVGGHKVLGLPLDTIQSSRKEVLEE